ncbi:GH39 family glycosyl hydrolase [Fodinicola feengrottensis]|uniref:Cellulase family glycosylhydrolase n=1 Tax=Fodinicola feengrottensis TaxID=435914 RepID=A0ABP4SJZ2_9ACTN|nr:beta-xylosidase [Fodinicola feengrottensis]
MTITLAAARTASGEPLRHFWSTVVGAGRANEGLRATWQEQLRIVAADCGFSYVRFHGLFHDDMFIRHGSADNFQYIDDLFDRLLDAGVRPSVELGFAPDALARQKATIFWWGAHGSPPTDYVGWADLVQRTVRHWVDRYGLDEVREWYFEVWNEPNLHPFFSGTRTEYFELYKATAEAVKAVDPKLRVGGPATSNFVPDARFDGETEDISQHAVVSNTADLDELDWRPVWLEAFVDYCHREALPVDFVSCHPYPTDWALDGHGAQAHYTRGVDATRRDLAVLRDVVVTSHFPDAEIHCTEWNSSPSSRDHTHDYLPAATFVVKANLESIGLVDSLAYWTFTDVFEEQGAGPSAFHGGFGLLTYQGIGKPTFHAYRFLHALGDELLSRTPGGIVTRHHTSGLLTALAYHYPVEHPLAPPESFPTRETAERMVGLGTPATVQIALTGLDPGAAIDIEVLDSDHGNVVASWQSLGAPDPLSRQDTETLRQLAGSTRRETAYASPDGTFSRVQRLPPWGVMLVTQR